jgi:hypothetical protein
VRLTRLHLVGVGPFEDLEISFVDADGEPRAVTVIHGDGGTGKSSVIAAAECTRPGNVSRGLLVRQSGPDARVAAAWRLEDEDPERPHALWVATPGTSLLADEREERLRRRESALFDKRAQEQPGFVFVEFSEHRCFPRASVSINDPVRTMLTGDTRGGGYSDRSRFELTRPCKQILAYAELAAALVDASAVPRPDPRLLKSAIRESLGVLLTLVGHEYIGVHPTRFEPLFRTPDGRAVPMEGLAKQVRHLIAFAAISSHRIWVGSGGKDPRTVEAVLCVDEVDLHLQERAAAGVVPALARAFPEAQWIVTTTSPVVAASVDAEALVALRRLPGSTRVELYSDVLARTH